MPVLTERKALSTQTIQLVRTYIHASEEIPVTIHHVGGDPLHYGDPSVTVKDKSIEDGGVVGVTQGVTVVSAGSTSILTTDGLPPKGAGLPAKEEKKAEAKPAPSKPKAEAGPAKTEKKPAPSGQSKTKLAKTAPSGSKTNPKRKAK